MSRRGAVVTSYIGRVLLALFCLFAAATTAHSRQWGKAVAREWHPSTSISAFDGGFYFLLNGDLVVNSAYQIYVSQPGSLLDEPLQYHDAVFTFSDGRWVPRESGRAPIEAPLLCDADNQIDEDVTWESLDNLPKSARVKDFFYLGASGESAAIYSTPSSDSSPLPHTYPLWLLISNPSGPAAAPMSLGDDGMYCGWMRGGNAKADYIAILRNIPANNYMTANIQLLWATPSSPQPSAGRRH